MKIYFEPNAYAYIHKKPYPAITVKLAIRPRRV